MADKSFGIKKFDLIGSGTPKIESPNNINLNAVNVAISTNATVGGTLDVEGASGFGTHISLPDHAKIRLGNTAGDFDIYYDNNAYLTTGSRGFIINSYNGSFAINVGASNNLKFGFSVVGIVCADDLIPEANGTRDLGLTGVKWKDAYFSGTVNANTFSGSGANLTGLTASQIPNLAASKITSGTLGTDRIPNLASSKITSGTFDAARIPTLNQDTTGNADTATQVKTQSTSTNATHYLTFVDSNNASATNETVYTDGGITCNPSTNTLKVSTLHVGGIRRGVNNADVQIESEGSGRFHISRDSVVQDLMPNSTGADPQYDIGKDPNLVSIGSSDFRNICGKNFISANGLSRFNTGISTFPVGNLTYDAAVTMTGDDDHGGTQRNAALQIHNTSLINNWGIVIRSKGDPSIAMIFYDDDDDNCGRIQINNNSTDFVETSDYRIKENETLISDGITRLKQLKPYRFNFKKSPSTTRDGFLAHEVQSVVPEAVTGTKDEVDSDGNMIVQGIDKSKLIPLLTAALQEEVAKREALEARVAALEGS